MKIRTSISKVIHKLRSLSNSYAMAGGSEHVQSSRIIELSREHGYLQSFYYKIIPQIWQLMNRRSSSMF